MTAAAPWYAIEHLPSGTLRVRVRWEAREFEAVRVRVDKGAAPRSSPALATAGGRRESPAPSYRWALPPRPDEPVVWLPRARDAERWAAEPEAWQPLDAAIWVWPNGAPPPPPLRECEPRMWSATCRFQAVEDATAADLAREMEGDRASANAAPRSSEPLRGRESAAQTQWWLDPSQVTYSPPGMISVREAEGRFMRALLTERAVRVERPRLATFGGVLASHIKQEPLTWRELAEQDPEPERWEPSGRDQDDMPVALAWRVALPADVHEIVKARSLTPPKPWAVLALLYGLHRGDVKDLYRTAIERLADEANGRGSIRGNEMRARWAAQRERNRAARRGE